MELEQTPGGVLRAALGEETPLQVAGVINAYAALLAQQSGFRALYLSGAGVANASFGLPDLGMTTLSEVLENVRRITGSTGLPLLVDADTGWGHGLMIGASVRQMRQRKVFWRCWRAKKRSWGLVTGFTRIPIRVPHHKETRLALIFRCSSSSPFKGEVRRGMDRFGARTNPTPTPTLPLKGREYL